MTGRTEVHDDLMAWFLFSSTPNEMRKLAKMIERMPDASDRLLRLAEQVYEYADRAEDRLKSQSTPRQKKKALDSEPCAPCLAALSHLACLSPPRNLL